MKRILLAALLSCTTAFASITATHRNTSTDFTSTSGSYSVTSTTAGNLMVVLLQNRSSATDTITSITGGGTYVRASRSPSTSAGRATEIWYCLPLSAGVTSLTVNVSASDTVSVTAIEYSSTLGVMFFDTSSSTTNATCGTSTCAGAPMTSNGANDLFVGYAASPTATFTGTAVLPLSAAGSDTHGNPLADNEFQSGSPQTFSPTFNCTSSSGDAVEISAVAFSDTAISATAKVKHKVTNQ